MSVLLPPAVIQGWRISPQTVQQCANENFSEAMLSAMSTNNTLRLLRGRPEGRLLRGSAQRTVTYIPFGLNILRALRNQTVFGNYSSINLVKKHAIGVGRFDFFFHQLATSTWMQQSAGRRFAVHMVFQDPSIVPSWSGVVRTDFGTYPVEPPVQQIQPVTMDVPNTFPYNMFTLPVENDLVHPRTTPLITMAVGESAVAFASRLKQLAVQAVPANTDSGVVTDLRLVNLFLVVVEAQRGGGGPRGSYWLTADAPDEDWIVNPRAVLTPQRSERTTCFWECLMMSLCMRQEAEDTYTSRWDVWMKEMCVAKATSRQRQQQLKRIEYNCPAFLQECAAWGFEIPEGAVSVDDVPTFASWFGFQSATVLSVTGDVLCGNSDDLHVRRPDTNHLVLLLRDQHFSLVTCYTALLPVKECPACGVRFATAKTLEQHMNSKSCLKCECVTHLKAHTVPFASVAEWRYHREHLETECLFRTQPQLLQHKRTEKQRMQIRFPHDKQPQPYRRHSTRAFEEMCAEDLSPVRQHQEALYVDLESVVPMNGLEVTRHELKYHEAYAIGWLRRSDALRGVAPTLVYGMHCLESFFQMLDTWWEELLLDETSVWLRRCREDVTLDATPRTVKGERNTARKIEMSWQGLCDEGGLLCPQCQQSMGQHIGWNHECAFAYYSKNIALKNMHENINDNAPRITVWAHNGGRYDWLFVHRYLMERNLLRLTRVVRGGGRYYEMAYRGVFLFRDSLNFVMGSLDRLGKDFQVETLKGIFPYRYLSDCSHIYDVLEGEAMVREKLPATYFELTDTVKGVMAFQKKRCFTEEEYVAFMEQRQWKYDVWAETEVYLAADIVCLFQVLESFRNGWKLLPYEPELFQYCTIGQMCHTYFLSHFLPPLSYPTLDVMEDAFIREALYGGRTEVFVRCMDDALPIHYVDVNSLYPHVMESCFLPSGDPVWHFHESDPRLPVFRGSTFELRVVGHDDRDMQQVVSQLNSREASMYGFVEVDVACPPDAMFPVLPERRNGKNMFTNLVKVKMVYYTEELKFAIARGAVVLKVHAWCEWTPQKVYASLISVLKAEKMRGEGKDVTGQPIPGAPKNPSLRAAAKTAQNALYGKSIQFINESVQIVDNQDDLYKLIRTAASDVSIEPIFRSELSDVVEVTVRPHNPRIQRRSCSAIGTAILAEARMVLYNYFEEVQRVGGRILYCDTDSIVFAGHNPLPDACLSDAVYGKMKVEIPPDEIVPGGFVALAPKCYSFLLRDNSPYVKCKGVNLSTNINIAAEDGFDELLEAMEAEEVLERLVDDASDAVSGLSFEHLRQMVRGEKKKVVTSQMQFFKTRDRHVAAIDTVKLLTDQFDKRRLVKGGHTFAWSAFNQRIEEAIRMRDVAYVSDFFNQSSAEEVHYTQMCYTQDRWFRALFDSWLESHEFSALYYISTFLE